MEKSKEVIQDITGGNSDLYKSGLTMDAICKCLKVTISSVETIAC